MVQPRCFDRCRRGRHRAAALLTIFAVALLASAATGAAAASPAADHLVRLDGSRVDATVEAIQADGHIRLSGSSDIVRLDGLLTIERPGESAAALPPPAACMVDLLGGGRLSASGVSIRDQQCHVLWTEGGEVVLPMEIVAAIRFKPQLRDDPLEAVLKTPKHDVDRLVVRVGDKTETIEGLVEGLNDKAALIQWQGKQQSVPRASIVAVVLAVIGSPPDRAGECLIGFSSGSSVWCRIVGLENNRLRIELAPQVAATVAWKDVVRVAVRSTRLAYLSDLEPIEAVQEPIVTLPMPWQRDRSVGGRTLTIAGHTFSKGLGVHAQSLLRFAADEKYDAFVATLGIDAETAGKGDCEFVVLGDGRELYRQRVTGRDAPRDIQIPIHGIRQVTLLVEPGQDLDLADHADWASARFLRTGPSR